MARQPANGEFPLDVTFLARRTARLAGYPTPTPNSEVPAPKRRSILRRKGCAIAPHSHFLSTVSAALIAAEFLKLGRRGYPLYQTPFVRIFKTVFRLWSRGASNPLQTAEDVRRFPILCGHSAVCAAVMPICRSVSDQGLIPSQFCGSVASGDFVCVLLANPLFHFSPNTDGHLTATISFALRD
jgi:hypothetical protein